MNITGVEADSEVIRLAHAYFPVNGNPKITIIHQDAVKFVESERNRYNLIVVDLFVEDQVPGDCQSLEFLSRLRHLLSENGKVYFNQMNLIHDTDGATTLVRNFETTFQSTRNINVYRGGAGNRVLIGK
jgi:spermidine synthase